MTQSILDFYPISRTRRNHGLEHATLRVLNQKFPQVSLGGISSPYGFVIAGNVTTEDVAEAAVEALKRLRAGENELAYHPNCGTNFAVPGLFAGLAAWLVSIGAGKNMKQKLERLPLAMMFSTVALILTQPLGPIFQKRITTSGQPQALELDRVETTVRGGVRMHQVITRG